MKTRFFALIVLVVISFAFTSTGKQSQYSENETANANLVRKVVKVNGIQNPDLIFPKQVLSIPFPKSDDRMTYVVVKDDELLKIADAIRHSENLYSPEPEKEKIIQGLGDEEVVFTLPEEDNNVFWIWLLIVLCFVLAVILIRSLINNSKSKEMHWQSIKSLGEINQSLSTELEKTRNKLPIEAPGIVDEKWLSNNNPIERPSDEENFLFKLSDATINRVFGKKPDLIATAIVSTKTKAVNMEFSHNRKALTGLRNVAVHLGWNWDAEKKDWEEVGMVASICSNGFQMNPERIVKTENLFTKLDVVSKERRPVTFVAPHVPDDAHYPALLKDLMIEFHRDNIVDLKKSGLTIEDLNKKTKGSRK